MSGHDIARLEAHIADLQADNESLISEANGAADRLTAQRDAVLALHQPSRRYGAYGSFDVVCSTCPADPDEHFTEWWPCATARALGVES